MKITTSSTDQSKHSERYFAIIIERHGRTLSSKTYIYNYQLTRVPDNHPPMVISFIDHFEEPPFLLFETNKLQKCQNYKMCRVKIASTPYSPNTCTKYAHILGGSPQKDTFRGTEPIFEFRLRNWDIGGIHSHFAALWRVRKYTTPHSNFLYR